MLTQADKATLRTAWRAGATVKELAALLKCSRVTVWYHRRQLELAPRDSRFRKLDKNLAVPLTEECLQAVRKKAYGSGTTMGAYVRGLIERDLHANP